MRRSYANHQGSSPLSLAESRNKKNALRVLQKAIAAQKAGRDARWEASEKKRALTASASEFLQRSREVKQAEASQLVAAFMQAAEQSPPSAAPSSSSAAAAPPATPIASDKAAASSPEKKSPDSGDKQEKADRGESKTAAGSPQKQPQSSPVDPPSLRGMKTWALFARLDAVFDIMMTKDACQQLFACNRGTRRQVRIA